MYVRLEKSVSKSISAIERQTNKLVVPEFQRTEPEDKGSLRKTSSTTNVPMVMCGLR